MKRVALIINPKITYWPSCRSIVTNYIRAYLAISHFHARVFEAPSVSSKSGVDFFLLQLNAFKPDQFVFIDHPEPSHKLVNLISKKFSKTTFVIHIYGDFWTRASRFIKLNTLLKQRDVRYIVLSNINRILMSRLLCVPLSNIHIVPSPVEEKSFRYRPTKRIQSREKLGLSAHEFVGLYAGRISVDKNVDKIIDLFEHELKFKKLKLFIVGQEDFYPPLIQTSAPTISPKKKITFILKKRRISPKQIVFVSHLPRLELIKYMHAADLYINLSTFHTEDFGMAPVEALMCGTPTLLTDWGGFKDFKLHKSYSPYYIPVIRKSLGLELKLSAINKNRIFSLHHETRSLKRLRSGAYAKNYSTAAVAQRLQKVLQHTASPLKSYNRHTPATIRFLEKKWPLFNFSSTEQFKLYNQLFSYYSK